MAIGAMTLLGIMIFLLTSSTNLFTEKALVYTYFDDAAAIQKGASVRLNGINIGKVTDVTLSGEPSTLRTIKIHMQVERKMLDHIPIDSTAAVSAENVLGLKFINIKRGMNPVTVKPGGEVKSLDVQDFDELVRQGYSVLASVQGTLKRIDAIVGLVEAGKGSIGRLLVDEELYNRLLAMMNEAQKITQALSTPRGTIGKLIYDDALYNDFRASMTRIDSIIADIQAGKGTAGKLLKDDAIYNEARDAVADLRRIVGELQAGKGSAGKLLKSEELHDQLKMSLAKIDVMLDKINAGQGTIGQLMVNPALFDNLNGLTQEMNGLMKDFRANPKKFLRIKLGLF